METTPPDMHPITWRVFQALRAGAPLSRNRNFNLFRDPRARRALTLYRYLRSVAKDVRANAESLTVHEIDDGETVGEFALRLDFPVLHGHRTAYLRSTELALLAQDEPEVAELIVGHQAS